MSRNHNNTPRDEGQMTTRGIALATVAALAIAGGAVYETQQLKITNEQKVGKNYLDKIHDITAGKVIISAGVKLRRSPAIIDGNDNTPDNLIPDYPTGVPKGKQLVASHAAFVEKNNDEWLVIKRPGTAKTATEVAFVDLSKLQREQSSALVSIENTDGHGGPLLATDVQTDSPNIPMISDVSYIPDYSTFAGNNTGQHLDFSTHQI